MNVLFACLFLTLNIDILLATDYYELLGIQRTADNREIRKAFKKLALKLHPDKNDEKGAHEKFLKINRAYEVLKDEELRKKYDMFGEEGMDNSGKGSGYQSWNYYHDDFGIYDDDMEIITLDFGEFQRSVLEGHDIWFINFYSPRCGHCHDLAPTWRKIAKLLQGVIRIGAVNCQDEFMLCQRQGIRGYPTLNMYTMDEGTSKYHGQREEDDIMQYVSSFLPDSVVELWAGNYDKWTKADDLEPKPYLLFLCTSQSGCPDLLTRKMVATSLDGIVNMGLIHCEKDADLCAKHQGGMPSRDILFFKTSPNKEKGISISASMYESKEIVSAVLYLVPGPTVLDDDTFSEMRSDLEQDGTRGWLVQFVSDHQGDLLEYKKLVHLIPRINVGKIDCRDNYKTCRKLSVTKFPSFVMFKVGGGYEMSYGKTGVQDVATFARISSQARTMKTLTADDFPQIITSGGHVFIDFFAPWCPPCMRLLPEFRKASSMIGGSITFGTVDCTVQQRVCNQHGVRAYPTTIFFNGSEPHEFTGHHTAGTLADFVTETLRPTVYTLTKRNFEKTVGRKSADEMWVVEFYAPWCGPCKQLQPHWAALGRKLENLPHVKVGKVDCEANGELCQSQAISSYPTIRMYPMGSEGRMRFHRYDSQRRDVDSLHQWVRSSLPSNVVSITPYAMHHTVLSSSSAWLVEFYAPWCSHCVRFESDYELIAAKLKGKVKVGKVNCERYRQLCSQAEISGYPVLRFYAGSKNNEPQEIVSDNIQTQVPDKILRLVEAKLNVSVKNEQSEDIARDEDNGNESEEYDDEYEEDDGFSHSDHDEL